MEDDDYGDYDYGDYDSGPFCRHWNQLGDCDKICLNCRHHCSWHNSEGGDTSCNEDECDCEEWKE